MSTGRPIAYGFAGANVTSAPYRRSGASGGSWMPDRNVSLLPTRRRLVNFEAYRSRNVSAAALAFLMPPGESALPNTAVNLNTFAPCPWAPGLRLLVFFLGMR